MTNISVIFENNRVKLVSKNNVLLMSGEMKNLYEISFYISKPECLKNIENLNNNFMKLHRRLGHIGFTNLKTLIQKQQVDGIEKDTQIQKVDFCEPCIIHMG